MKNPKLLELDKLAIDAGREYVDTKSKWAQCHSRTAIRIDPWASLVCSRKSRLALPMTVRPRNTVGQDACKSQAITTLMTTRRTA